MSAILRACAQLKLMEVAKLIGWAEHNFGREVPSKTSFFVVLPG